MTKNKTKNLLTAAEIDAAKDANDAERKACYGTLGDNAREADRLLFWSDARRGLDKATKELAEHTEKVATLTAKRERIEHNLASVSASLADLPSRLAAVRDVLSQAVQTDLDAALAARRDLSDLEAVEAELSQAKELLDAQLAQVVEDLVYEVDQVAQCEDWQASTSKTLADPDPLHGHEGWHECALLGLLTPAPKPEPQQQRIDIIAPAGSRGTVPWRTQS